MSKVILLLSLLVSAVTAFPNVAGYCGAGVDGIGSGAHRNVKVVTTGELSTAGFELYIGGQRVYKDFQFYAGQTYTVELKATADIMRGFLLRLSSSSGENTKDALDTNDSNAQVFDMCLNNGVGGLSHINSNPKTSITGTLYMASATGSLTLDVTTVVSTQYSYGSAEWYFSQFTLQAVTPGTAISNTAGFGPTAAPTNAPCASEAGAYCINDAACCTGRCIRADTNAVSAPGYCDTSSSATSAPIQAAPPATSTTTSIYGSSSGSATYSSGRANGASCGVDTDCLSNHCILLTSSFGFCWT